MHRAVRNREARGEKRTGRGGGSGGGGSEGGGEEGGGKWENTCHRDTHTFPTLALGLPGHTMPCPAREDGKHLTQTPRRQQHLVKRGLLAAPEHNPGDVQWHAGDAAR